MPRVERSLDEKRRIGMPSDQSRIDNLERLMSKIMAFSVVNEAPTAWAGDQDKQRFGETKDKLDQLDIDHPDAR